MGSRGSWIEDNDAFADLYTEHAGELVLFFARRVLDSQAAFDLTAETFAQAFLTRSKFRGRDAHTARAWLYGIARHQLSRFHRAGAAERRALAKLGIDLPAISDEEHRRVEDLAEISSLRDAIRDALGEIPPSHREALQLRVVEERSYSEVASALGVSEQTARARVSRGLRAMAGALGSDDTAKETA